MKMCDWVRERGDERSVKYYSKHLGDGINSGLDFLLRSAMTERREFVEDNSKKFLDVAPIR